MTGCGSIPPRKRNKDEIRDCIALNMTKLLKNEQFGKNRRPSLFSAKVSDQTLDSSFSVNQNNKSFTTSDYISDLRNNPAKSNTGIQLESYTGEGSTHISIKSKNGEKCFQILNDSFPQSDFAPAPLFLQNINQGCGSAEVNPILRGLEERKSR